MLDYVISLPINARIANISTPTAGNYMRSFPCRRFPYEEADSKGFHFLVCR